MKFFEYRIRLELHDHMVFEFLDLGNADRYIAYLKKAMLEGSVKITAKFINESGIRNHLIDPFLPACAIYYDHYRQSFER